MPKIANYVGYCAFGVALTATLSSLLASEVFNMPPCDLCWYQRIFMYPLVFIIGIGIIRRDKSWPLTTIALSSIGWLIALYHSLLQWGVIPSSLAPCTGGISCAESELTLIGFITIPFMSLLAFSFIIVSAIIFVKGVQNDQRV